jgi:heat shock protein HtpX
MSVLRRIGFFLLVNFMVMVSVSIILGLLNVFLFQGKLGAGSYSGLLMMSVVWGSVGSVISLMMSKFMAKRLYGLKMIDPKQATTSEAEILNLVYSLARTARLPAMPEVGIYDSPEMNAFATGPTKSNSLVAVSSGLLRSMNREQVEGVLAHEIAHVANGDMVTMALLQGIINSFVIFFSFVVANALTGDERGGSWKRFLLTQVLQVAFGILGSIPIAFYSRAREYRADKGGARYAGKEKMIGALQALQRQVALPAGSAPPADDAFSNFKIAKAQGGGIVSLFSTHPPLENRILRLERGV